MSAEVKSIHGGPIDQQVAAAMIDDLRDVLTRAENGEFVETIIIAKRSDGTWTNRWSGSTGFAEMAGRLAITLVEMILQYTRCHGGEEPR